MNNEIVKCLLNGFFKLNYQFWNLSCNNIIELPYIHKLTISLDLKWNKLKLTNDINFDVHLRCNIERAELASYSWKDKENVFKVSNIFILVNIM